MEICLKRNIFRFRDYHNIPWLNGNLASAEKCSGPLRFRLRQVLLYIPSRLSQVLVIPMVIRGWKQNFSIPFLIYTDWNDSNWVYCVITEFLLGWLSCHSGHPKHKWIELPIWKPAKSGLYHRNSRLYLHVTEHVVHELCSSAAKLRFTYHFITQPWMSSSITGSPAVVMDTGVHSICPQGCQLRCERRILTMQCAQYYNIIKNDDIFREMCNLARRKFPIKPGD
jgi:hypothetical protein